MSTEQCTHEKSCFSLSAESPVYCAAACAAAPLLLRMLHNENEQINQVAVLLVLLHLCYNAQTLMLQCNC